MGKTKMGRVRDKAPKGALSRTMRITHVVGNPKEE